MAIPCCSSNNRVKNKLKDLAGMIIYTIDDDVETNCDECNSVETETSAVPKDGALT